MGRHKLIIGTILFSLGILYCFILLRIYNRFSSVEVEAWQQLVFTLMVAITLLQLATSYCMIFDKPWPNKINIFISAFNLIVFPIGTFAGIYYFWYYLKSNYSHKLYQDRYK